MELPVDFQFTQSNLQAYLTCRRLFELNSLRRIQWPSVESEPIKAAEKQKRRGDQFHRLLHRYFLGIPVDVLAAGIDDIEMAAWWERFHLGALAELPAARLAEVTLSAPLAGFRLIARFDLIAVEPGARAVIADWKTSTERPTRDRLLARLQTVVYRYLLVRAGAHLNGGAPLAPEQVSMVYWFARHPDAPEHLVYDAAQYAADGAFLESLAAEITERVRDGVFELTEFRGDCDFCTYRSLCEREQDTQMGEWMHIVDGYAGEFEPARDFEQSAEVRF